MSKVKSFSPTLYESHFEAIKHFIHEGPCAQYDFNVCTKEAAENALAYLCLNDIPHQYHMIGSLGLCLVTISWQDEKTGEHAYCFWCEGEV